MRIADMDAPARRETVRNPHPLLHAAECLKTRFCITANTIYCVCMIYKILYVVFPRSAGEHNRRFSDTLPGDTISRVYRESVSSIRVFGHAHGRVLRFLP